MQLSQYSHRLISGLTRFGLCLKTVTAQTRNFTRAVTSLDLYHLITDPCCAEGHSAHSHKQDVLVELNWSSLANTFCAFFIHQWNGMHWVRVKVYSPEEKKHSLGESLKIVVSVYLIVVPHGHFSKYLQKTRILTFIPVSCAVRGCRPCNLSFLQDDKISQTHFHYTLDFSW